MHHNRFIYTYIHVYTSDMHQNRYIYIYLHVYASYSINTYIYIYIFTFAQYDSVHGAYMHTCIYIYICIYICMYMSYIIYHISYIISMGCLPSNLAVIMVAGGCDLLEFASQMSQGFIWWRACRYNIDIHSISPNICGLLTTQQLECSSKCMNYGTATGRITRGVSESCDLQAQSVRTYSSIFS